MYEDYGCETNLNAFVVSFDASRPKAMTSFGSCKISGVTLKFCCVANQAEVVDLTGTAAHDFISLHYEVSPNTWDLGAGSGRIVSVLGGPGQDQIWGSNTSVVGYEETLIGGPGDDTIRGGAGDDKIYGNNGGDRIEGGTGDDWIWGGNGDDDLDGGEDVDHIYGQAGHDDLSNSTVGDVADGGPGNDDIACFKGDCFGGDGNDTIYASIGDPSAALRIHGGPGNDELFGGDGPDVIYGGAGVDDIKAGAGNDVICESARWTPTAFFDTVSSPVYQEIQGDADNPQVAENNIFSFIEADHDALFAPAHHDIDVLWVDVSAYVPDFDPLMQAAPPYQHTTGVHPDCV
ncbi:MAG: hypothetical protein KC656_01590, partial [Myxococcales bacterium]|nr:hypothetical protein [Myxococcales bacterium]